MTEKKIDFAKGSGLVPAIVQHAQSGAVLMLGYLNDEALKQTLATKRVHFFSRSKDRLWMKGESSGNVLEYISHDVDCDQDAVLIQALPAGPTCHTGAPSCFAETKPPELAFLSQLQALIVSRKTGAREGSYVASLFHEGTKKIAQKVIEEAGEVALEAMAKDRELFLGESADLLFHYLVLLADAEVSLAEVLNVLEQRHQKSRS